ncbi:hypothetical protein B2J93_356 [Marssonina coronariae]|uniref:Uncharacterized protein n=1 Tax=Diplocarpon coronariae TaxID=2795749 RepID=A0A218YYL8_9HELO|nr:hypothetical protein B2J93_356 [Marssonina coronariae]
MRCIVRRRQADPVLLAIHLSHPAGQARSSFLHAVSPEQEYREAVQVPQGPDDEKDAQIVEQVQEFDVLEERHGGASTRRRAAQPQSRRAAVEPKDVGRGASTEQEEEAVRCTSRVGGRIPRGESWHPQRPEQKRKTARRGGKLIDRLLAPSGKSGDGGRGLRITAELVVTTRHDALGSRSWREKAAGGLVDEKVGGVRSAVDASLRPDARKGGASRGTGHHVGGGHSPAGKSGSTGQRDVAARWAGRAGGRFVDETDDRLVVDGQRLTGRG